MARIRTIRPEFFLHETLSELSPITRLSFIGLWTLADREGRLEDRPKRIRASLFPYETHDVDAIIGELHAHGFVVRYEVDGVRFIAIPGFAKHQHCHMKEPASSLPAPCEHGASMVQAPDKHESRPLDSLMLDAGYTDSLRERSAQSDEIEPKPAKPPTKASRSPNGSRLSPDWQLPDDWWNWAQTQGWTGAQAVSEAEKFRDYWIAQPGAKGRKCDWQATWRNWIRRADKPGGRVNGKSAGRFELPIDRFRAAAAKHGVFDEGEAIGGDGEVVASYGRDIRS